MHPRTDRRERLDFQQVHPGRHGVTFAHEPRHRTTALGRGTQVGPCTPREVTAKLYPRPTRRNYSLTSLGSTRTPRLRTCATS